MVKINIVAQSGHAWIEEVENIKAAKARASQVAKEHGDIERVELLNNDESLNRNIWVCKYERPRR